MVFGTIEQRPLARGLQLLETETLIPRPLTEVFPFFSTAENLERITPPELRFRIVTPTPVAIDVGAMIDYRLRLYGIPFRWRSRIPVWQPPHRFVDEQERGPYGYWHHEHRFDPVEGGTLMRDTVHYRLPLHPLSAPALPLLRGQLARIFRYRAETIVRLFGVSEAPRESRPLEAAALDESEVAG